MLFMSPLSGWMFDSYGPRLPIFIGTILHVLGLMMTSLSKEYYQFALSQSVCSGIGASFVFTPAMTAVCDDTSFLIIYKSKSRLTCFQPMTFFKKKRAIAGGLTIAGSSLGGVVFPLMASRLIPKIGFPWAIRACAFLILFLLVITNLTISSNLEHSRKPFKISNFVRPLRELNYILMCLSSFFLYCKFSHPVT